MLPLTGASFPDSTSALNSALSGGFDHHGLAIHELKIEGDDYPALERLTIDLSGAEATRKLRVRKTGSPSGNHLTVTRMALAASPLLLEGTPVRLRIEAQKVTLDHATGAGDNSVLLLAKAADGSLEIEMLRKDLETLIQTIASAAAAPHGVEIKETRVILTSRGPRALSFEAEIVAKMFFVKAPIKISGDLDLEDNLDLRISKLAMTGSGVAAGVAGGFIRPHFERIQRAPISLAVLSLGEIKLRDVELTAGETIRLSARFGS